MKGIPREVKISRERTITNSSQIRLLKNNFFLNNYQKDILIGTLLGDSGLYKEGWAKNYRLQIEQGDKQKDYLFWKFDIFRNCCFSEPSYQNRNKSWRIRTLSHDEFNRYASEFYRDKKKVIPQSLIHYLNPLVLAVWFMDDGALGPRGEGYIINTQSFSYKENEYLRLCLEKNFALKKISIHKDKQWWRLYIKKRFMNDFRNLISSYIISSMRYKL